MMVLFETFKFFHCDSWGFCCFPHHSPQYPGGQDAVASSTHEVFNSSISFELLYNRSESTQWYIETANYFVFFMVLDDKGILHVFYLIFIP